MQLFMINPSKHGDHDDPANYDYSAIIIVILLIMKVLLILMILLCKYADSDICTDCSFDFYRVSLLSFSTWFLMFLTP